MVKREQQTAVRPLVFELYPPASEDRRPANRAKVMLYQAPPWLPVSPPPVCGRGFVPNTYHEGFYLARSNTRAAKGG